VFFGEGGCGTNKFLHKRVIRDTQFSLGDVCVRGVGVGVWDGGEGTADGGVD
jgi:hypothetical protein